jgi:lipopolysaccharide/colanic/teichoic acid biosynthesis glycosyltransferase
VAQVASSQAQSIVSIGPAEIARHRPLHLAPPSLAAASCRRPSPLAEAAKRAVDVACAALVLVATAPLLAVIAVLIKREDGGPVFFRQRRVGRDGQPFTIRKFRSMRVDAEAETGPVWAQVDDPRSTRIGRWMRPVGIDEIPQAWNVLRGDMSLIGPRPERPEFVTALADAMPGYAERHLLRPGITGWAQVHLGHDTTLEFAQRKLAHDLHYVRACSLRLDAVILCLTVQRLAGRWRALLGGRAAS